MGKKDATSHANQMAPVDKYRKELGKHDWKRENKPLMKDMKNRKDARKSAMSMQEIALLLVACLAFLICIYALFYVYMSPKPAGQEQEQEPDPGPR